VYSTHRLITLSSFGFPAEFRIAHTPSCLHALGQATAAAQVTRIQALGMIRRRSTALLASQFDTRAVWPSRLGKQQVDGGECSASKFAARPRQMGNGGKGVAARVEAQNSLNPVLFHNGEMNGIASRYFRRPKATKRDLLGRAASESTSGGSQFLGESELVSDSASYCLSLRYKVVLPMPSRRAAASLSPEDSCSARRMARRSNSSRGTS
jgi:hypothetical protein